MTHRSRLLRRRLRTRILLVLFLIPTVFFLLHVLVLWTGFDPETDPDALEGSLFAAIFLGLPVVVCWAHLLTIADALRAENERPVPAGGGQRTMATWSHTAEPLRRLAAAEAALADLLDLLAARDLPAGTVKTTRVAARDAATVIRLVVDQVGVVERALPYAMNDPRMASALERLTERIEKGLTGYGALIAAAGELVASAPTSTTPDRLVDATEQLRALAYALRELAPDV